MAKPPFDITTASPYADDPKAPLTTGEFREFVTSEFRAFVELYTTNHAALDRRLGTIETMLWQGQAIEEMQQRIIGIARAIGNQKLADPFIPSPGMAQPAE